MTPETGVGPPPEFTNSGSGGEVTVEDGHGDHDRDAGEDVGDGVETMVVDAGAEGDNR
jgi:hypothetical protein